MYMSLIISWLTVSKIQGPFSISILTLHFDIITANDQHNKRKECQSADGDFCNAGTISSTPNVEVRSSLEKK